jgi:FADH2 O2-dependent halogenase
MPDVVIIGGGPAGSILGAYLSKAGVDNAIFEKAIHPRPHVGESMVTATTRIFDEIGFLPVMEEEGFPKKYGASWHGTRGEGEYAIWFKEFPQEGINQDYTYHVDRSRFDLRLLQHAKSLGSEVYQGIEVREVLMDGERATGVRVAMAGTEVDIPAKIVVDASGRNTILGTQMRLKTRDPIFNQFAVHAWFEHVARTQRPDTHDFIHIYFLDAKRGWGWQIPITDTITSIGVVAEKEVFQQSRGRVEDYWDDMVQSSPDFAKAMEKATRVNDFKTEADYSYSMERFVGDGYLLIGDAARFVDPIFSSGVSVAAHSAKFASEVIVPALEKGDVSTAAFAPYEARLREGVEVWYEFIKLYYKLLHLFTFFIAKDEYRIQVLRLLQGDVYNRSEATALDAMREVIETVESTPDHLWAGYLTDMPID